MGCEVAECTVVVGVSRVETTPWLPSGAYNRETVVEVCHVVTVRSAESYSFARRRDKPESFFGVVQVQVADCVDLVPITTILGMVSRKWRLLPDLQVELSV